MREKQELLKREGEREREASNLSIYARWGGVIRDDGNIKSGERAVAFSLQNNFIKGWESGLGEADLLCLSRCLPDAVLSLADLTLGAHAQTRRSRGKHRSYANRTPRTHLQGDLGHDHQLQGFVSVLIYSPVCADASRISTLTSRKCCHFSIFSCKP